MKQKNHASMGERQAEEGLFQPGDAAHSEGSAPAVEKEKSPPEGRPEEREKTSSIFEGNTSPTPSAAAKSTGERRNPQGSKRRNPAVQALTVALVVLILAFAALCFCFLRLQKEKAESEKTFADHTVQWTEQWSEQQKLLSEGKMALEERENALTAVEEELDELREEMDSLRDKAAELQKENRREKESLAEAEKSIKAKENELTEAKKAQVLAEKERNKAEQEREALKTDLIQTERTLNETKWMLSAYQKLVENNHGMSSAKISELFTVLEQGSPTHTMVVPVEEKTNAATDGGEGDGNGSDLSQAEEQNQEQQIGQSQLDASDAASQTASKTKTVAKKAAVAYYYKDLTTNYTIAYHEDVVMYSASLIKAPYLYCVLEEIAAFEHTKRFYDAEGNPLYDGEGTPLFEGEHPNLNPDGTIRYLPGEEKYDLSRTWTYDAATMFREGSGKIQSMPSGTTMTYQELVEYTLLYSDNVAFAELRNIFGMDSFHRKAAELGIEGTKSGFMYLTAEDCGKFLTEIYRFFQTDSEYARLMRDCMEHSGHTVMIVSALTGKRVAHKYGWDTGAYHDMAVVLEEHPYVLVIMTDLEEGGSAANAFVQRVTRLTDEIHTAHYS